ncbi:hypothetical protein [Henriciella aquimarina]|uniref:hypothetical protein n=1 Tax=Henriciella aquimarina TaxID=545261 RepID=UPI000A056FF7|nr:hypothetical protein [Henriciella aquimarina]
METPDRHLKIAMERAWPLLTGLAATLAALIGLSDSIAPKRVSRSVHIRAMRLLRPAEALLRRLIVLMARELYGNLSGTHPTALSPIHVSPDLVRVKRDQTKKAHFQLFEPLATVASCDSHRAPKPVGNPRILSLDAPYPAEVEKPDGLSAARLVARVRALRKVLDNPKHRAKRFARFLARKAAANTPMGRLNPVRPGWPPGARSRHTPPWLTDMLRHLGPEVRKHPPWMWVRG